MEFRIELVNGLHLRLFERKDVPALHEALQTNQEHLSEWRDWTEKLRTQREVQVFVDKNAELFHQLFDDTFQASTHPGFQFGIFDESGKVWGMVGFQGMNLRNRVAALGYWIIKEGEGKGFITQSCKKIIEYGWDVLQLNRYEIQAWIGNKRSAAVAERLGFVHEAILKSIEWRDGKFIDHHLFRLVPEDIKVKLD